MFSFRLNQKKKKKKNKTVGKVPFKRLVAAHKKGCVASLPGRLVALDFISPP